MATKKGTRGSNWGHSKPVSMPKGSGASVAKTLTHSTHKK